MIPLVTVIALSDGWPPAVGEILRLTAKASAISRCDAKGGRGGSHGRAACGPTIVSQAFLIRAKAGQTARVDAIHLHRQMEKAGVLKSVRRCCVNADQK